MTTTYDWTAKIREYGEYRSWKPLPQRMALKKFRLWSGLTKKRGVAADKAFRTAYRALARATPDERAEVNNREDVNKLVERQNREDRLAAARRRQEKLRIVNRLRDTRCWTLQGFFLDDTEQLYTLSELEAWVDSVSGVYVYRKPSVYVYALDASGAVIVSLNWSVFFTDYCGEDCRLLEKISELRASLDEFCKRYV